MILSSVILYGILNIIMCKFKNYRLQKQSHRSVMNDILLIIINAIDFNISYKNSSRSEFYLITLMGIYVYS